jgi:uncharacterized protein (TIGR02117 family)
LQSITWIGGPVLLLCGCAAAVPLRPPGPAVTTIAVVERGWHTDVCVSRADADAWIMAMAHGFGGARLLCFGFGDRHYLVAGDHGPLAMLAAMLPGRSVLLMTALSDSPAAAFGAANVASLGVSRAGLSGLQAFLRHSTESDPAGAPLRLGDGPYPGSVFFAGTGTYDGLYTCNTWTADAMRSAGLPVSDAVLFAGEVMRQARRLAVARP